MTWTTAFQFLLVLLAFGLGERIFRKEPVPPKDKTFDPLFWAIVCGSGMGLTLFSMFSVPFFQEFVWDTRRIWWSWVGALPGAYWAIAVAGILGLALGRFKLGRWHDSRWLAALPILLWVHMAHPSSEIVEMQRWRAPEWKNGVCMQSTGFTCTPSAAATLLKAYRIDTSESEMAARCGTSRSGTHVLGLARGLASKLPPGKFTVRACRLMPEEIKRVHLPCITFTSCHAWVIFKINPGGTLEIGEALGGRQTVWWHEFNDSFSGEAVLITPNKSTAHLLDGAAWEITAFNTDSSSLVQAGSNIYREFDDSGRTLVRFGSASIEKLKADAESAGW